jgi:DNA-binding winged helix-turn-helix (wHTH) protein/tetratricopeptide (TPR) repeat protein
MGISSYSPMTLRFGVFELDLRAAELRKHGLRTKLQEQPFRVLAMLLERPGELVTRDELRQQLWPAHTYVDFDRSLNKAVNKLRLALGDSAESPRFIETIPRHGYRFIADVNALGPGVPATAPARGSLEAAAEAALEEVEGRAVRSSTGLTLNGSRRHFGLQQSHMVGIVAFVLVCAGVVVYRRVGLHGASTDIKPRPSIAVLGFRNLSGLPEEAWLSTALSDWLTTELAVGNELRTIPEENVARMRMELSLPNAGSMGADSLSRVRKNLGTDLVVVGSYAKLGNQSGDQIRLDLRLQDTRNGETIDAFFETGTESHLFGLVSRAGAHLRAKLGVQAATAEETAEVGGALPSNPNAVRLYSEGLAQLRVFDALAARDLLQKAVSVDPNFALSRSALSTAWAALGYDEKARDEARKALDLSSSLPRGERLLVEGRYREISRNWEDAIVVYQTLFQFFPDNLEYGLALADAEVSGGKGKDALLAVGALRNLPHPLRDDPRIDLAEARAAESMGDFRRVEASAARAAQKAQAAGTTLLLAPAQAIQAWASVNLGEPDRAMAMATEAGKIYAAVGDRNGVASATTLKAIVLDDQGDALGANKMFEDALAISAQTGNKRGVATGLLNTALTLKELGDLVGARKKLDQSMRTYREIEHQDGVANVLAGWGDLYLALGNPAEAKRTYLQSLEICRQIGDRSKEASAFGGLGRILREEADLDGARKYLVQAQAAFEEIGDKRSAAEMELAIANLLVDQGAGVEAAVVASKAAEEFDRERVISDESLAYAVIAHAFLAQERVVYARRAVERATALVGKGLNREVALAVAIAAARVDGASGGPANAKRAAKSLQLALAEATAAGFVNYQLEARLAQAEIKMRSGDIAGTRTTLELLQKDAAARGFSLIARKAATARRPRISERSRGRTGSLAFIPQT